MLSMCEKAGHRLFEDDGTPTADCHITAQGRAVCKACRRTGNPPGRPRRADGQDAQILAQQRRQRRVRAKTAYSERAGALKQSSLRWETPTAEELALDLPSEARLMGDSPPSEAEIAAYIERELARDRRAEEVIAVNRLRDDMLYGDDPVLAAWAAESPSVE